MGRVTRPAPSSTRVLAAAITVSMTGVLPPMLTGTLGERVKTDLALSDTGFGLVLACFFLTAGLGSTFGGRLADRIGWRRSSRLAALGGIVVLVTLAAGARSTWALASVLAAGGFVGAVAMPAGSLAIARELPIARQGLLFGLKQTAIPLSGLLAGVSVPAIALTIGWRWAYAVGAVVALSALVLVPTSPEETAATSPSTNVPASQPLPRAYRLLSLGGASAAVAISAMVAFLLVSAVDAGLSEGAAGILIAAASATGLTVRVTSGWLADRTGSRGFRPVAAMQAVGALGFLLLAVHLPATVVLGALIAYGVGWGWPGLFHFGAVLHSRHAPGAAVGMVQVGLATGSAFGPLLFGAVADTAGYSVAWLGAAALLALAATLVGIGSTRLAAPVEVGASS